MCLFPRKCSSQFLLLLVIFVCLGTTVQSQPASLLLDSLEHRIDWVENRLAREQWDSLTLGRADSLAFYHGLRQWVLGDPKLFTALQDFTDQSGPTLSKRRSEILYPLVVSAYVDSDPEIAAIKDTLYKRLCRQTVTVNGENRTLSALQRRLYYDTNEEARRDAYEALNTPQTDEAALMGRLIRLRNQRARSLGYNNFPGMMLKHSALRAGEIPAFLDSIESQTDGAYASLTDKVRREQSSTKIEIWDMTQFVYAPFKAADQFLNTDTLMDIINTVFQDLGFRLASLPVYLEVCDTGETFLAPRAVIVRPPEDQRVYLGGGSGWSAYEHTAEQIGRAVAACYVKQQHKLFRRLYDPIWDNAGAVIFSRLATLEQSLRHHTPIPAPVIDQLEAAKENRRLFETRLALVRARFEYDVYQNPNRNLNRLYWEYFHRIMLLPAHKDLQPWALNCNFVNDPLEAYQRLVSETIAAQTIQYMLQIQDTVLGNPDTRAFLIQNYFRFGSRFGWKELVERGTSAPLTTKYILKQQ